MNRPHILIIDDEEAILDACSMVFSREKYFVNVAKTGEEGYALFKRKIFDCIIVDLKLPGIGGMEILRAIKEENQETPVIMITGYATVESAIEAMKLGALDYLIKPFSPEELRIVTKKALSSRTMLLENIYLKKELETKSEFESVVGKSIAIQAVLDLAKKVSPSESTVLITGESGTGKELIARMIHHLSPRAHAPFVVVDCGSLVESLFESELFGHEKGSFTGAIATKHGRLEIANGGAIFLDEVANISLNIQAKLLRVIQEREVSRLGSSRIIKIDVRIIAATNKDLSESVKEGLFRDDLFYRLNVVPIHLPPLREHLEDIPLLVHHFLQKYNKKAKREITSISPQALKALTEYHWPGNVRELENTIERAVVLSKNNTIEPEDLIYHGLAGKGSIFDPADGKYRNLDDVEREYIKKILEFSNNNRTKAAETLGIDRKTLRLKIKKYNL
jgi:two-component system, NtrC family, response regulator HydG